MTEILINATQPEEIRVAITENGAVFDFDMESIHREDKKASVYKGIVSRVEPSLNAIFVDYGADRHGFLPLKELAPEYFQKGSHSGDRFDLKTAIKEGQELIVQISKEERGTKGAALSTFITLAGCYLVLMPNNESAGGISRRIEGEDRQLLKETMDKLEVPEGMGVIIRTNGLGRSQEELQWDLNALIKVSNAIQEAAQSKKAPFLIYRESDVISRTIRDYLRADISHITVDTQEAFERVLTHVNRFRPEFSNKVSLYRGDKPLFINNNIEHQIETAYSREVKLPSGGSLVIDHTEALVSIDINSSRATKGEDIEETALQTNLEAAMEIARQARLRDLGGLIVIDFIDMLSSRHQRDVETQLQESLKKDRARVQLGRISRFGLLEMSRQRLRPSLDESTHITCPRCDGQGTIRGVESLALSILRLLEEEAATHHFREFQVELPISVATFLLNEKRHAIHTIENKRHVRIILIPSQNMQTPHYEIKRFKQGSEPLSEKSYEVMSHISQEKHAFLQTNEREEAAIISIAVDEPPKKPSLVARLFKELFSSPKTKSTPLAANQSHAHKKSEKSEKSEKLAGSEKTEKIASNRNSNTRKPRVSSNNTETKQTDSRQTDSRQTQRPPRSRQAPVSQQDSLENPGVEKIERPVRAERSERLERPSERTERAPRAPRQPRPDSRQDSRQEPHQQDLSQENLSPEVHAENQSRESNARQPRENSRDGSRDNRRNNNPRDNRDSRDRNSRGPRDSSTNYSAERSAEKSQVVIQSFERYETKTTAPTHQISDSVQSILNSNTQLSDKNSQQANTTHRPENYQRPVKLSVEVQETKTEFSLEEAKARLATKSSAPGEQVASRKAATPAPSKLNIESEEI